MSRAATPACQLAAVPHRRELRPAVVGNVGADVLRGFATVVPLGATELKGKREPVPVYGWCPSPAEGGAMRERAGPFWDAMQGRASLPRAAATLGMQLIEADVDAGTIELGFAATEDLTNPTGNVLGAFQAAMLYDRVGPALLEASLADAQGMVVATATARVIALRDAPAAA